MGLSLKFCELVLELYVNLVIARVVHCGGGGGQALQHVFNTLLIPSYSVGGNRFSI